jgi:hypothetical protein
MCLFSGLMRLLDWIIQSSIYVLSSGPPQHMPLHRAHLLPTAPAASNSSNLATNRDWFFCSLAKIIWQSSSSGVLWAFVYFFYSCFIFSLYFVVLAYWVEDVNNFLVCESKMMSFGKRILLSMYRIESVTSNKCWCN